jgi:ABC-2 type transport system permease protein
MVHAEWTKIRTAPGTSWLLLAVVALTVAVSAASSAAITCQPRGCAADPTRISLTGVQLGQAVVAILAVLAIGTEYGTGMIHISFTAMPRRTSVLAAKAAILAGIVAAASTIAVVASLLAGRFILPGHGFTATHGYPLPPLSDGPVLRATAGSILYLTLIALLSLGIAAAVRDSASAIGIVLGLLYVFPIVTQVVTDPHWRRHFQQVAPMSAGLAVQATTDIGSLPIGPWSGLGVLAAWSAAALLTGGLLLRWRDA